MIVINFELKKHGLYSHDPRGQIVPYKDFDTYKALHPRAASSSLLCDWSTQIVVDSYWLTLWLLVSHWSTHWVALTQLLPSPPTDPRSAYSPSPSRYSGFCNRHTSSGGLTVSRAKRLLFQRQVQVTSMEETKPVPVEKTEAEVGF